MYEFYKAVLAFVLLAGFGKFHVYALFSCQCLKSWFLYPIKIPGSKRDARKYRKCPPLWLNHDIPTLYVPTPGNQNDGSWNNSSHLSHKTFLVCLVRGGSGDSWLLWILFNKVDTWVPPSECKYNLTLPLTICSLLGHVSMWPMLWGMGVTRRWHRDTCHSDRDPVSQSHLCPWCSVNVARITSQ